jgi:hypothetical protein
MSVRRDTTDRWDGVTGAAEVDEIEEWKEENRQMTPGLARLRETIGRL